jgi:Mor family transcriptional regulator
VGPNRKHQEIYAAYSGGESIEQLAERYQIKMQTVASIVMAEKHRHAVSPLPEYKALRKQAAGFETMH